MRPCFVLSLLTLGSALQATALNEPKSRRSLARGFEVLTTRDLDSISAQEAEVLHRALMQRGLFEDIWQGLKHVTSCTAGEALLATLKILSFFGDEAFIKVMQRICKLDKIQADDVCHGAIALEGSVIATAIRKMSIGSRTSRAFLTTFLGVCGYPDPQPWNITFPSAKPPASRPVPSGKDPISIVHYSDIHLDPLYVPGSSTQCDGRPICCRPYSQDDEPGNTAFPAGPYGDHKCDVPFTLEKSMYDAIHSVAPNAAFTIFTGDIVDHAIWNTSKVYNSKLVKHAYTTMNQTLKTVYGTAGNHEGHPVNSFAPNAISHDSDWIYDILSEDWAHWIGSSSSSSVLQIGAYSTKFPHGNLRIISLNTNLYYRNNFWLYHDFDTKDPNGQIAWLIRELDAAERARERVYIMGHMPLGEPDALRDGSNYLDQVFRRYSSTIAAMFYGHTHVDHFEVSYADYSTRSDALVASYIAPSLTPMSGMPSFRVYSVDPETFAVLDHTTYVADMTNPAFQENPVWTKFYSAKEAYGPVVSPPLTDPRAELSPSFWHNLTLAFERDDDLFNAYISRKSRGWRTGICTGKCKSNEICQLRSGRSQDNCWSPIPGVHWTKRSGIQAERGEHDECGTPITLKTLSAVRANKHALGRMKLVMKQVIDEIRGAGGHGGA